MSNFPKLGNEIQTSGSFYCDMDIIEKGQALELNVSNINIDNKLFNRLFKENKICIEIKVECFSTYTEYFFKIDHNNKDNFKVNLEKSTLTHTFHLIAYLKAVTDFTIVDDTNESLSPYYNNSFIPKNVILSKEIKIKKECMYDLNSSQSIFHLDYDPSQEDFIKIDFPDDADAIKIIVNDSIFKELQSGKYTQREKWKLFNKHSFWGNIFLQAVEDIRNRNDDELDYEDDDCRLWHKVIFESYEVLNSTKLKELKPDEILNKYYKFFIDQNKGLKMVYDKYEQNINQ
jgi:hypothetical protein